MNAADGPVTPPVSVPPAAPADHLSGSGGWLTAGLVIAATVVLAALWATDVIRPGSLARRGVRKVDAAPWWIWIAAAVLVYIVAAFCGMVTLAAMKIPSIMSPPFKAQVVMQMVTALGGIAAGVAVVRMIRAGTGPGPDGLSLRWSDGLVGLWCFLVSYPVMLAVSQGGLRLAELISGREPEPLAHETLKQMAGNHDDPWVWGLRITAVLLVPAFEELVYRVGIQSAILRATGKPWAAVAGTTVVFTLAHKGVMPWYAMAVIATLSLAMGIAYERTKRLGVPIVMHALFNAVNVAVAMGIGG